MRLSEKWSRKILGSLLLDYMCKKVCMLSLILKSDEENNHPTFFDLLKKVH